MNWSDEQLVDLLRALPPAPAHLVAQAELLPEFLPDPTLEVDPDSASLGDGGLIDPATGELDGDAGGYDEGGPDDDIVDDHLDDDWLRPG